MFTADIDDRWMSGTTATSNLLVARQWLELNTPQQTAKRGKGAVIYFLFFLNNEKCVDARSPKPVGKEEGFRQLHVVKKKMLHMKIRFMLILKSRLYSDIHKQV